LKLRRPVAGGIPQQLSDRRHGEEGKRLRGEGGEGKEREGTKGGGAATARMPADGGGDGRWRRAERRGPGRPRVAQEGDTREEQLEPNPHFR
jgi:hypothetical protein